MSVATTTQPRASSLPAAEPGDRLYRLSVAQYLQMAEQGVLTPKDRVELLEGQLVVKPTRSPTDVLAGRRTFTALSVALPAGWHVAQGDPIALTNCVPEPDIMVVRGRAEDYPDRWPGPQDVALVVEVAESSVRDDQVEMKEIYARAGVSVYWIVNLPSRRLEVHTEPTGPAAQPDYRVRRLLGPEDEVSLVLDGREVARLPVRDLLP